MTSLVGGRRGLISGLVLLALGIALPFVVYPVFAIDLLCFALFAVAFDLLLGFTGALSFGHAMFWGGSGYIAAMLLQNNVTAFPLVIALAVLFSGGLALGVGALSIKRSGIYFAMITLALAQIVYFLAVQFGDYTGGENGLLPSTRGTLFGLSLENDRVYYFVALVITALAVAFVIRVVTSPFGAVLAAMRENETRARSIGYDVERFKLAAFVLSGSLAGLAGALHAVGKHLIGLESVDWHTSGQVVIMTILGGIGTVFGPIVGAGVYESLDYFVSKTPIGDKTNVVMGTVFAVTILLARRGIVGEIQQRFFARKTLVAESDAPLPLPDVAG
jgi:branched-chain amino acid transport system permease protein